MGRLTGRQTDLSLGSKGTEREKYGERERERERERRKHAPKTLIGRLRGPSCQATGTNRSLIIFPPLFLSFAPRITINKCLATVLSYIRGSVCYVLCEGLKKCYYNGAHASYVEQKKTTRPEQRVQTKCPLKAHTKANSWVLAANHPAPEAAPLSA